MNAAAMRVSLMRASFDLATATAAPAMSSMSRPRASESRTSFSATDAGTEASTTNETVTEALESIACSKTTSTAPLSDEQLNAARSRAEILHRRPPATSPKYDDTSGASRRSAHAKTPAPTMATLEQSLAAVSAGGIAAVSAAKSDATAGTLSTNAP
eukprot:Amastigsp_a511374_167.p5 type:complete len:157 gc:universal Amastigsp_a511374_167:712-242(-)